MSMLGTLSWEWILVVVFLLYFFGTPILILFTFRAEVSPTLETVDDVAILPQKVIDYFHTSTSQFADCGFEYQKTLYLPEAVNNVKTMLVTFTNRRELIEGIAAVVYAKINERWKVQLTYCELSTSFADDGVIDTGNQNTMGAFPQRIGKLATIHPDLVKVQSLVRCHRAIVAANSNGRRPILNTDVNHGGDFIMSLIAGMSREFEDAKQAGYLKYNMNETPRTTEISDNPFQSPGQTATNKYQPTLKGAYLMTWNELWPIKQINLRIAAARSKRIRHAAGFDNHT